MQARGKLLKVRALATGPARQAGDRGDKPAPALDRKAASLSKNEQSRTRRRPTRLRIESAGTPGALLFVPSHTYV